MKTNNRVRRIGRILLYAAGIIVAVAAIGVIAMLHSLGYFESTEENHVTPLQRTVVSKDGTSIAYEQSGTGPVLILVAAALSDREGTRKLAGLLAPNFAVINYDRRGRGASTDRPPYAAEREVEDIEALVEAAGGSAFLFGSSSGSVLALDAASRLGSRAKGVFLYEPPFIVDNSRPPMPSGLTGEIQNLVASDRRADAVKMFFNKGMGIPGFAVTMMRLLMPGWSKMTAMAHTIPYDLTILAGTQDGKPLPRDRWNALQCPTLVMVGSRSEAFFHSGAKALAAIVPGTEYRPLPGRDHSAVQMAPKSMAEAMTAFFESRARSASAK